MSSAINTKDLSNKKVWIGKPKKNDPDAVKKVGRIRAFVFHPSRPQLVGFLIKRPDVALMFHRDDMFVAYNGFKVVDGDIVVREDPQAHGRGATKALGINLDNCVLWLGLPVMCADGTDLGMADNVEFDPEDGSVVSMHVSKGATANTLLGTRSIPGSMVKGFKRGMGTKLYLTDDDDNDPDALGCVLVSDEAKDIEVEGGVAEKAGEATAIATDKVQRTYKKVVKKAKPVAKETAAKAGKAVQKGVFATGRQIARTEGMFSNFKNEFKRAYNGEDTDSTEIQKK